MKAQFSPLFRIMMSLGSASAVALLLLVSASAANAANTSIKATTEDLCENWNLTGRYVQSDAQKSQLHLKQKGCLLTVIDPLNHTKWQFDLSGQTETQVPREILDANKDSELARRSLESMRIRTQLTLNKWGWPVIEITVRENLPKVVDTALHKGNSVDLDIEFTGKLYIAGSSTQGPNGSSKALEINGLSVEQSKARVTRINDLAYTGVVEQAFVAGANYILKWVDGSFDSSLVFVNLRRIQ